MTSALWPPAAGPDDLAAIEAVPLQDRGLPVSTYAALARAAGLWPDKLAVRVLPDAQRWRAPVERTYRQLLGDVHRTANALHALGVGRGDAIALLSTNCLEMLTALLAAEAIGVAVPINPGLTAAHAAHLIELAQAQVLIAAGPHLDAGTWASAQELAARTSVHTLLALQPTAPDDAPEPRSLAAADGIVTGYLAELSRDAAGDRLPVEPPRAESLASCLHTGGTTGTPKLAARTHANEVANAWMIACADALAHDDVVFAALPLFHTNALLVTTLAPLLRGQTVVWAGPLGYRDPALYGTFWRLVQHYRVAAMSAVPTVYQVLAQVPVDADVSSLKYPIVGAAPLPPSLVDQFKATTGVDLCEGYGLTEGTCGSTRNFPGRLRRGTVGQRLPYQQMRAIRIDQDTGAWEPLPAGRPGVLAIKGPNVFAGYLTAGPNGPVAQPGDAIQDGWLNTGDLGTVDADGYVRLAGRTKDLIIRGGHNIDPQAIEDALLAHPAVTAAAAVGRPDPHSGEVPVAYVTLAAGAHVEVETLMAHAAEHVPERAAAPKAVEVVDAIPLTPIGKPYKNELRRRAAEQAARDALPPTAQVRAELDDGTVRVVVAGVPDDVVADQLAPFSFGWRTTS